MSWLELLEEAIQRTDLETVARELDYAKSSLSLARHGRYPGSTARIEAAVQARYGRVACPFLGTELTAEVCRTYRNRPSPTSSARALKHWSACQSCPHHTESNMKAAALIAASIKAREACEQATTPTELHEAGEAFVQFMDTVAHTPADAQRQAIASRDPKGRAVLTAVELFRLYQQAGQRVMDHSCLAPGA